MNSEQWQKIDNQEKNIKVALLCGWTEIKEHDGPTGYMSGKNEEGIWMLLPDYLHDLNAMHEAEENAITDPFVRRKYYQTLDKITGDQWNTIVATAEQRAEAFVITMS